MQINFQNLSAEASWRAYKKHCLPLLAKTLEVLDHSEDVTVGLVLVDAPTIRQYNKDYRNIDKETDVLSFADATYEGDTLVLGDIMISVDAIRRQAKEYKHSLKREFCFLLVHGYLHLLGYDHQNPEEEKEMFALQKQILNNYAKRIH